MIDTLVAFDDEIQRSTVLDDYNGLEQQGEFVLMTMHRPGNVDTKENLLKLLQILNRTQHKTYTIVFPIHPRKDEKEFRNITDSHMHEVESNRKDHIDATIGLLCVSTTNS